MNQVLGEPLSDGGLGYPGYGRTSFPLSSYPGSEQNLRTTAALLLAAAILWSSACCIVEPSCSDLDSVYILRHGMGEPLAGAALCRIYSRTSFTA